MKGCIVLLLLLNSTLYAQFRITGELKDRAGKPVAFANLVLGKEGDSLKVIQGTTSDSTGLFELKVGIRGRYWIRIHAIGYQLLQVPLNLEAGRDHYFNDLVLEYESKTLQTVTVSATKSLVRKTATGFIVNADATLSQQGGSAVDLLRNTPTVFVDGEGAISLRGRAPLILINGRNSRFDNLTALPANSIERIEVITSPGASYDAEAENGIINIILKKGKTDGLNGAFSIANGWGASWRLNNSALLNFKKKQWNLGIGYDNRLAKRTRKAEAERVNYALPDQYLITQNRSDNRNEGVHNFRASLDYSGNTYTLGAEFLGSLENETNLETLFSDIKNKSQVFQSGNSRFSDERRKGRNGELALKAERKLRHPGEQLSLNFSTSFGKSTEQTGITTQAYAADNSPSGTPFLQQTRFTDNNTINSFRLDYTRKLGKGEFGAGYKGLQRIFQNSFAQEDEVNAVYVPVPGRTGTLDFREWVHALYAQYKQQINPKWEYELGVRAEQTSNSGSLKTLAAPFNNEYGNLFQTLNIGFTLSEKESFRFTYGKRINRPSLGQLNPFTDITDSLTQRSGNPALKPEISHVTDLGYTRSFTKGNLLTKLYYRYSRNSILPYTVLRPDGVLFTKPLNAGTTQTLGWETVLSLEPARFWKTNWSFSVFRQEINAGNIQSGTGNTLVSWNTKWINDILFSSRTKCQLIGVYNAPTATIQGQRIAVYNVDFAFQQKIGKERSRLGLIITDIFNTQQNGFKWNTPDFRFTRTFKVDSRAVLLTFAYTFGTTFREKLMENNFTND